MMRQHGCHAKECPMAVPPKMFMCKKHWYRLPKDMRDAVWREYNPGQEEGNASVTRAYCTVTDEAIAFIVDLEAPVQGELF